MDLSTMTTRVRELLNEPTARTFTDASIQAWINLAYKRILGETEYKEGVKTLSSVQYQQEYSYASDVIKIKNVRWEDDYLIPIDWRDYIQRVGSQNMDDYNDPIYYTEWNEKLYLYPIPSASATTTTCNGAVTTDATTITAGSTSGYPSFGAIAIDNEVIYYTDKGSTTFNNCTRGQEGSTAAQHSDGATITERDITYYYLGQLGDLGATDEPVFPEQYHELLVFYATMLGLLTISRINEARVYKGLFNEGLEEMKRKLWTKKPMKAVKDTDRYPTLKP